MKGIESTAVYETPACSKEVSAYSKTGSIYRQEAGAGKKETSTNTKEMDAYNKETGTNTKEMDTYNKETGGCNKEMPARSYELTPLRMELSIPGDKSIILNYTVL